MKFILLLAGKKKPANGELKSRILSVEEQDQVNMMLDKISAYISKVVSEQECLTPNVLLVLMSLLSVSMVKLVSDTWQGDFFRLYRALESEEWFLVKDKNVDSDSYDK